MTTISDIKAAMIDVLLQVSPVNGYTNLIDASHVRGWYDGAWIDDDRDTEYPKVMVIVDSGSTIQQVAERHQKTMLFLIFVFVKKLQADQDQVNLTESFIEDVEKAINEHSSLNGTVNNASVQGFITDGGVLAPQGCAIVRVEVLITDP